MTRWWPVVFFAWPVLVGVFFEGCEHDHHNHACYAEPGLWCASIDGKE